MVYYAIHKGFKPGVYTKWLDCKKNIDKYNNPIFKKFDNKIDAENFVKNGWKKSLIKKCNQILKDEDEINEFKPEIIVFTDGSCINNGKPNAKAGYGIYFGENDSRNISKKIEGKQSNNTGELTAIYELSNILLNEINNNNRILVVSDSIYAIRCATSYGEKNAKINWSKNIPNIDLVKKIYEIYNNKDYIKFYHIYSHTNKNDYYSKGNEQADLLANKAIII